jgi:transposase
MQLDTIPGVNPRRGEHGRGHRVDMSRFPNADHLVPWAGMCPGSNESAGKRRNPRTRKGNPILRSTLT